MADEASVEAVIARAMSAHAVPLEWKAPASKVLCQRERHATTVACVHNEYTSVYTCRVDKEEPMPQRRSTSRGVTINLRADQRKRSLIDRAAETVGKNRSEFMLDAACREATSVLLDQRLFLLDEKAFKRFNDALDKPPADNPRLRRLLATKAPWER